MRSNNSAAANGGSSGRISKFIFLVLIPLIIMVIISMVTYKKAMDDSEQMIIAAQKNLKRDLTANEIKPSLQSLQFTVSSNADASKTEAAKTENRLERLTGLIKALNSELDQLKKKQEDSSQHVEHAMLEKSKQLEATLNAMNDTIAGLAAKGHTEVHELQEEVQLMMKRVVNIEYVVGKVVMRSDASRSYFPSLANCDLDCNNHGLSIDIPGITDGCSCFCVGGWTGPFCQKVPRHANLDELDLPPPKMQIPREREEVPPLNESAPGCKDAALKYYQEKYKSTEFRTDTALKFFWTLAHNSIHPMCSDEKQQVVVIDIGANVGEQLTHWDQEFLNLTHCPKRDSLLVLVEPNPQNLVVLNHTVAKFNQEKERKVKEYEEEQLKPAAAAADGDSSTPTKTPRRRPFLSMSGKATIVDSAMSYYDGYGKFVVNKKQIMGKKRGNERGSLNLGSQDKTSKKASTLVYTKVQRVGTMIQKLQAQGLVRSNYTIPLLKIDAEGYDPAVIFGSSDILHRTNIVVFECHKLWKQAGFSFHDVVEYFAKFGFSSYKMGMFYWIPVTPPAYWDDSYEDTMVWSNCIAIRNGHPFGHMFSSPSPCV